MKRLLRLLPLALLLLGLTGAKGGCSTAPAVASRSAPGHHAEYRYARRVFGNDAAEQRCLLDLWTRESSWDRAAVNPKTGAYGIPQANPADFGHPFAPGDWRAQIRWGHRYIHRRYGDACTAWNHEAADGWY